jgi:hypothetical protein
MTTFDGETPVLVTAAEKAKLRLREVGEYCDREHIEEIEQVVLACVFSMLSLRTTDEEWDAIKKEIFYVRT